jgi:hypothetical protein
MWSPWRRKPKEVEMVESRDEAEVEPSEIVTDLDSSAAEVDAQPRGIGSEGRVQYPSEVLYIVREANIVEELDEVLASKGVELKGEQDV